MSVKVVRESHVYGDDYVWVPSTEDLEELEERLDDLASDIAEKASSETVDEMKKDLRQKIKEMKDSTTDLQKKLKAELEDGDWKHVFKGELEILFQKIEHRYSEINSELDSKLAQLTECSIKAETVEQIFIQHEQKMQEIITQHTKSLIQDLQRKNTEQFSAQLQELNMESFSDQLQELNNAAQQITWS